MVDGIGGTVKRSVWNYCKANAGHVLSTAEDFAEIAALRNPNVLVKFISSKDIQEAVIEGLQIWECSVPVPNTHKVHYVTAAGSKDFLIVGDTSDDLVKRKVKIVQNPESSDSDDSEQEYGERFEIERNDLNLQDLVPQKDWVVVKYDNDYYPGEVQCVEQNEAKVKVMHCSKSGAYYFWPTDEDCIMYKAKDIVKKIEPPEPYGGTRDHYKFKSIIGPLPDVLP